VDKPRIIISVYGGLVQDVFCSIPDAQVVLVDWDQDPEPPFPRDDLARGRNDCSALVGSFYARTLNDLADTDEEFAIHDAQEKGLIDEPIFAVS